jgi:hypothetical protein
MTISTTARRAGPFIGNGVTVAFPFGFKIFNTGDLLAQTTTSGGVISLLTVGTDYTVLLNPNQDVAPGGVLTCTVAPASGTTLLILSNIPETQPTSLQNQGGMFPQVLNDAYDRIVALVQQLSDRSSGFLRAPTGVQLSPMSGIAPGRLVGFNESGQPVGVTVSLDGDVVFPATSVREVFDANYASLALAVTDAILRKQILRITQSHTISSNTTIACPVVMDGGSFTSSTARTLTFTRGLEAGWDQIFFGDLIVTGLRDVAAEWWGAKSDDTGDASVGWNKANACRMSAALTGTTVGEWRHRLNERGTYRFMSTAELHVSATAGLTMRGGGPIFQTILKAGSGSSGTILLKITAPLSGLDKIVTFDIGGFSVVEEAGTSMICGLQIGDTVTGSYGDKTYALRGVTYSKISNVQSNGFTNGFKNVNASFIEYDNCTAWNQTNEAFIGFWDYADRAGAVGFINYNNCYVAGSFGDVTRIGHLTDSTSGGYATRIIGTIVMEDSGYQRFMKYAEGGALANIEVGSASELDGDLNPATSARGVFVQCEDLLAYAGPASSCRNIIINSIWCAGHNDAAVTFKTVKAGSMRDIKILNSAIANHTGNAILIDGPIDGVMISNVSFQECSSAGPLVWLTNGVTKAVVDGVTLTQPTPALTVSSVVQIDSTCDNVSVENILANEANCTAGLIVDNTPNTARKSIVSLTKGALVKPTGASVYSYAADRDAKTVWLDDFGTLGTADDRPVFDAAATFLGSVGGVILIPRRTDINIATTLNLPDNVCLDGQNAGLGSITPSAMGLFGPRINISPTATITLGNSSKVRNLMLWRAGLAFNITSAQVTSTFVGSAITLRNNTTDHVVNDCVIFGFEYAIRSVAGATNVSRWHFERINFDCQNGLFLENNYDVGYIREVHGWPFVTSGSTAETNNVQLKRSGATVKLSGLNDWVDVTSCFGFGYMQGFYINNADSCTLMNCKSDHPSTASDGSYGFIIDGTAFENRMIACQAAGKTVGALISSTDTNGRVTVDTFNAWECLNSGILVTNGTAIINSPIIRQTGGAANGISIDATATEVRVNGGALNGLFVGIANASTTTRLFWNNIDFANTLTNVTNDFALSVASADPLVLDREMTVFLVTGTTNFGTISNPENHKGRSIVLKFAGALTVNDGGNMNLAGSFVTTADDTLVLVSTGTGWLELSRSVN